MYNADLQVSLQIHLVCLVLLHTNKLHAKASGRFADCFITQIIPDFHLSNFPGLCI